MCHRRGQDSSATTSLRSAQSPEGRGLGRPEAEALRPCREALEAALVALTNVASESGVKLQMQAPPGRVQGPGHRQGGFRALWALGTLGGLQCIGVEEGHGSQVILEKSRSEDAEAGQEYLEMVIQNSDSRCKTCLSSYRPEKSAQHPSVL